MWYRSMCDSWSWIRHSSCWIRLSVCCCCFRIASSATICSFFRFLEDLVIHRSVKSIGNLGLTQQKQQNLAAASASRATSALNRSSTCLTNVHGLSFLSVSENKSRKVHKQSSGWRYLWLLAFLSRWDLFLISSDNESSACSIYTMRVRLPCAHTGW